MPKRPSLSSREIEKILKKHGFSFTHQKGSHQYWTGFVKGPTERIEGKILLIRGQKVMLERDLAELYGVKAIRLREQVKRNIKRFPSDFMFQLTEEEVNLLVSHFVIPSKKYLGGYLPYVFTEQGVAMLSSVLNSERAIMVNIQIMRAFTSLRRMLASNEEIKRKIEAMEKEV